MNKSKHLLYRKKSIIFFVSSSQLPIPPPKGGAIEKLLYELYLSLNDDFSIYLISNRKTSDAKYEIIPSINIGIPLSIMYDIYWGLKLSLKIKEKKPHLVVMNTPFVSLIPLILRRLYPDTKFIYVSHNPSWTVSDEELGLFNKVIKKIEKFIMLKSDKTVAIAEAMKRGFIKHGINSENIVVIHNFIDTKKFIPVKSRWKEKRGIKFMVLFVGKLTKTKGVPLLIKTIPNIVKKFKNIKFVFVGGSYYGKSNNPYIDLVKKLNIMDYVLFTGSVDENELIEIYSSADVLVLPTTREGMPRVILEALSCGVPVIASNISGIPEVVDNKTGVLIERNNSHELKNALIKMINESSKYKKNARKKALEFSLNKISKKWKKMLYDIIDN